MEGRTVLEWDKDDIDALGILKVDVPRPRHAVLPAQGLRSLRQPHASITTWPASARLPGRLRHAVPGRHLGVFQVESRAQMNMLPRLEPERFYDLVIEVAIVRPGPIQGDMVHPYLRRRDGEEPVELPSRPEHGRASCEVLGKTLGVPLFQEQAMRLAIVAAGFTPEEADQLRRAMATFKRRAARPASSERWSSGMVARGYHARLRRALLPADRGLRRLRLPREPRRAASRCWSMSRPGSSATTRRSSPAPLLNSQPMGFYAPAQIVRDAREHGVEVRPVDVNHSLLGTALWSLSLRRCHRPA